MEFYVTTCHMSRLLQHPYYVPPKIVFIHVVVNVNCCINDSFIRNYVFVTFISFIVTITTEVCFLIVHSIWEYACVWSLTLLIPLPSL